MSKSLSSGGWYACCNRAMPYGVRIDLVQRMNEPRIAPGHSNQNPLLAVEPRPNLHIYVHIETAIPNYIRIPCSNSVSVYEIRDRFRNSLVHFNVISLLHAPAKSFFSKITYMLRFIKTPPISLSLSPILSLSLSSYTPLSNCLVYIYICTGVFIYLVDNLYERCLMRIGWTHGCK